MGGRHLQGAQKRVVGHEFGAAIFALAPAVFHVFARPQREESGGAHAMQHEVLDRLAFATTPNANDAPDARVNQA